MVARPMAVWGQTRSWLFLLGSRFHEGQDINELDEGLSFLTLAQRKLSLTILAMQKLSQAII